MEELTGPGLFKLVRHPNYLLYSLYRSFGTPLACGLWWAPLAMLAFTLNVYRTDSVPNIEQYMAWKYKEKWAVCLAPCSVLLVFYGDRWGWRRDRLI